MKIYELFDKHITRKLDKKFANLVYRYTKRYILGNNNHSEFYGGITIGVTGITFKTSYVNKFFNDIVGVEAKTLRADFKLAPSIVKSRKVSGDTFNILLVYLARRIEIEKKLPKKIRIQCREDLMRIFCYRTTSALHNNYFSKYLVPQELGTKVADALGNLFIIKRLGSWNAYIEYRVDKVFDPKRKDYKRLISNNDDELLAVIIKLQGAIRSTFQAIYAVHLDVKEAESTSSKRSIAIDIDGESEIADMTVDVPSVINKVLRKFTSRDVFIKKELITLICTEYLPNYKESDLEFTLKILHKHLTRPEGIRIYDYARNVLAYSLNTIRENLSTSEMKDAGKVLKYIRGVITSSRSSNPDLLKLREEGSTLVKDLTRRGNIHYLSKTRIALILYILLLTY